MLAKIFLHGMGFGLAVSVGGCVILFGIFLLASSNYGNETVDRVSRLPIFSRVELNNSLPGSEAVVEGRISASTQPRYQTLVAYERESRQSNGDRETEWEEEELVTPPLLLETASGLVQVEVNSATSSYDLGNTAHTLPDGPEDRYNGFRASDEVMALGVVARGSEGQVLDATLIYGGTRETYIGHNRGATALLFWMGAIVVGFGIGIMLLWTGFFVFVGRRRQSAQASAAALPSQPVGVAPDRTSPTFQSKLNRIRQAQREVEEAIRNVTGQLGRHLGESVLPQTHALVERAATLVQKGQAIEDYLRQASSHQVQQRINQVDTQIAQTTDSYTIDQLQGTREALAQQLTSTRALETYIGRIIAQLDNIETNLRTIPTQIMHLRASDVHATTASAQVAQHLSTITADMDAFVGMLDTAMEQTRDGAAR